MAMPKRNSQIRAGTMRPSNPTLPSEREDIGVVNSLEEMHRFVIARIYHEDILLAQRTYNFLTLSLFMGAALVAVPPESVLRVGLCVFGLLLSSMHIAMGRTLERTIKYWRAVARIIERKLGWDRDSSMYDFFDFHMILLPDGTYIAPSRGEAPERRSWLKGLTTNLLTGVFLPASVAVVWCGFLWIQTVWGGAAAASGLALWISLTIRWAHIPQLDSFDAGRVEAEANSEIQSG